MLDVEEAKVQLSPREAAAVTANSAAEASTLKISFTPTVTQEP